MSADPDTTAGDLVRWIAWACAGPLIWAAHLGAVLVVTELACTGGRPGVVLPAVLVATVVGAAAAAWVALRSRALMHRRPADERLAPFLASALGGLAVATILWTGLPAAVVPPCP